LAILAVLVLGATVWNFVQGTFRFDGASVEEMQDIRSQIAADLPRLKEAGVAEATRRVDEARKGSLDSIDQRLMELGQKSAALREEIDAFDKKAMALAVVAGDTDALEAHYRRKIDLEILGLEEQALAQARQEVARGLNISARTASARTELKSLTDLKGALAEKRKAKTAANTRHQKAVNDRKAYEAQYGGAARLCREAFDTACSPEHERLLGVEADALKKRNEAAKATDDATERLNDATSATNDAITKLNKAKSVALAARTAMSPDQIKTNLDDLDASIAEQANRWEQKVRNAFWPALGIWLGAILLPIALKMLGYFVFAPLAQRLKPVEILKGERGEMSVGGKAPRSVADGDISKVSVPVSVGTDEELLVHPDYLQSTGNAGEKGTKWLLDWRYPLSSLAAGLVMLTRIRPAPGEPVVVSSRKDPFSEIALITIPEGSAAVLQPRCLAGVVQKRDNPLRIGSHWRLGTLNAWLTWQMRFLVFHGPVTVIAKGTRGVRIEPAGSGRSINQQATIGFSAGVGYGVRRCETFMAYLRGEQALFNDTLSGGKGYYIYEEMPAPEHRKSLAGRGIEGMVDAGLKVFGI
jgi:hypothetical protein